MCIRDRFAEASTLVGDTVDVNKEMIQENLDADVPKKGKFIENLIALLSGIVSPIIPAMLAAGFITALAKLAVLAGVSETNTTIQILSAVSYTHLDVYKRQDSKNQRWG